MTSSPAEGLKTLLTTHVATSGWQIEIGAMPGKPDRIIMISDTGGSDPNPKWLLDFPTVQIQIRGVVGGYQAAFNEAKAVKDLCLGFGSGPILGDQYVSVTMLGDMSFIGRDENERPLFTNNFRLIIEPQVVAETNRLAL